MKFRAINPNTQILGDCIKELKSFPDETFDLIIIDPPFNISQSGKSIGRKTLNSKMHKRDSSVKLDFGEWDKKPELEYREFTEKWFKECARVLKDKGWFFIFFSKERVGYFTDPINGLFLDNGFKTRTIISWHKTNPVPSFRKVNFLSSCEFIVVGSKGDSKLPNFLMQKEMHNFFQTANSSAYGKTKHPTEKPTELIKWLIKVGSNEGDLVLDCFGGSGTTAVACKELKRNYILIEKEQKYYDMALSRLSQECLE